MSDYILKKGSEGRMSISIMTEKMIGWAESIIGSTKYAGWCLAFIEDGRIIHAWDKVRIDDYLGIEKLTTLTGDHPNYLGWVPLKRVLNQKPQER